MKFTKVFRAGLEEWFPGLQGLEGRARRLRIRSEWVALGLLLVLAALYAVFVGTMISRAYVDIGDGNYLYTSSRIADGLTIYRDFLSPQPPMHLLVGSLLIRFGRLLGPDDAPLYVVRIFSLLLHLATMLLIYILGRRVAQTPWGGLLAGLLYLLFPTGLWWSLGYQSESQEIFWLMLSLLCFVQLRPKPMVVAGAAAALAVLTNMTAAPYAAATLLYLVLRHGLMGGAQRRQGWRLTLAYAAPLVLVWGAVAAYYQLRTGAFFGNTITNQVGAFPREDLWAYVMGGEFQGRPVPGKVPSQTAKILTNEGGLVLLGILGLLLHNRTDTRAEREYLVWYALALVLSFFYVAKGGTMDYIFTIGEPILAVFGALFLTHFFYLSTFQRFRGSLLRDTSLLAQFAFLLLFLATVLAMPVAFLGQVRHEDQYEKGAKGLEPIENQILAHSKLGDAILADPYYAFITRRHLVEEFSELYLWCLKYSDECQTMEVAKGDLTDPAALLRRLGKATDAPARAVHEASRAMVRAEDGVHYVEARTVVQRFAKLAPGAEPQPIEIRALRAELNDQMTSTGLYQSLRNAGLELPAGLPPPSPESPAKTPSQASQQPRNSNNLQPLASSLQPAVSQPLASNLQPDLEGADLIRANRLLLEAAFPGLICPSAEARRPDGEGVATVKAIAARLRARAVPVAALSVENLMLMRAPEIRSAIARFYKPLTAPKAPEYRTQNFQMQVFVPKTDAEMAASGGGANVAP